jgi:hypothetical protein
MSAKLPIMERIHDQNDPVIPNPGQPEVPDPHVPELAPEPQQPEIQEPPPAPVEVPQPGIKRP